MTDVALFEPSDNCVGFDNSNNICNNIIGTSSDRCSTPSNTERIDIECNKNYKFVNDANINIYRYKFTDEFTSDLFRFSKVHQYDHRKDFKEAWNSWLEENEIIVTMEKRRLTNLGYDGNIEDKMFKSARYYFRKKGTEKKAPSERRAYVGVQQDLLDAMDNHIKNKINSKHYKPSEGFDDFCKTNVDLLREEVIVLCQNGVIDSNEIKKKIKKTYKNRYFLFISK
jgi:hypothetical protein